MVLRGFCSSFQLFPVVLNICPHFWIFFYNFKAFIGFLFLWIFQLLPISLFEFYENFICNFKHTFLDFKIFVILLNLIKNYLKALKYFNWYINFKHWKTNTESTASHKNCNYISDTKFGSLVVVLLGYLGERIGNLLLSSTKVLKKLTIHQFNLITEMFYDLTKHRRPHNHAKFALLLRREWWSCWWSELVLGLAASSKQQAEEKNWKFIPL